MTSVETRAALAGLVVGVPASRKANESATLVRRYGGEPVVGPTIVEVAAPDETLRDITAHIVRTRPAWSVHLTGVGTRRWFTAAERLGMKDLLLDALRSARIVARGPKTRAAMHEYGLEPTWIPPDETSRTIAQWLAPQLHRGESVIVQCAGRSVTELTTAIEMKGARAIEVVPYAWSLPDHRHAARELATRIADGSIDVLLVTSAPQIHLLLQVAHEIGNEAQLRAALRGRVFVGAVGRVAAAALEDEGLDCDVVAEPPRLGELVRTLARSGVAIRTKRGKTT